MTTRWRPDFDPDHLYFVTTTAAERTHIFRRDVVKRILVDSLYYTCLMNQVALYAFVIMPNHVHVLLRCPEACPLRDWARAFKAGASRLIVRQFQVEGNGPALKALQALVTRPDRQAYKVWEDGYLAKAVWTPDVLAQKLAYIHGNPVQPQWGLAEAPEGYGWSSARFYVRGEPALIPLRDAGELLV